MSALPSVLLLRRTPLSVVARLRFTGPVFSLLSTGAGRTASTPADGPLVVESGHSAG